MTENIIRFSHDSYLKFDLEQEDIKNGSIIELIGVSTCAIERLPKAFLEFDASWIDKKEQIQQYPLPKGMVIVLFFWHSTDFFSTIRSWTKEKEAYYKCSIGEQFKVVIE